MDVTKLKPIGNRILVKIFENSDTSDGGIFVGQATTTFVNGKDKAVQETVGEVIAVGTGVDTKKGRRPIDVEIGQVVCFSDTCGRVVDDQHKMIREDDIAFFMDDKTTVELIYKKPENSSYVRN